MRRIDLDEFVAAYRPGEPVADRVENEREIVEDLTAALAEFEALATALEAPLTGR
ncbi:MAG: hypothetical protein ACR2P2_02245 [Nakamurella sp.]